MVTRRTTQPRCRASSARKAARDAVTSATAPGSGRWTTTRRATMPVPSRSRTMSCPWWAVAFQWIDRRASPRT